jgi:hypothetical protein
MQRLTKLLRFVGWCGFGWAAFALLCTFWPLSGWIAFIALVAWAGKRGRALWHHGTARWASEKELRPLTKAKVGILLGRIVK